MACFAVDFGAARPDGEDSFTNRRSGWLEGPGGAVEPVGDSSAAMVYDCDLHVGGRAAPAVPATVPCRFRGGPPALVARILSQVRR